MAFGTTFADEKRSSGPAGNEPTGEKACDFMADYLVRRVGKLLFPRLARDQRKRRLSQIALVLLTSVTAVWGLVSWMTSYRH